MSAPTFGVDLAPCRRCDGTGVMRRPPMSKTEERERSREKHRRRVAGDEPLPRPSALVACVRCAGTGYQAPSDADADL